MKQTLTNGILTYKYGFDNVLKKLQNRFLNEGTYSNEYLQLKYVNSIQLGIVRFDFFVTDEEVKKELYNVEENPIRAKQDKIYGLYTADFTAQLVNFLKDEVEIVKEEMKKENQNIEYETEVSIASLFDYMKHSGILRLEILL